MIRNLSILHRPLNIKSSRLKKTTNDVRNFRLKCTLIVYGKIIKILTVTVYIWIDIWISINMSYIIWKPLQLHEELPTF